MEELNNIPWYPARVNVPSRTKEDLQHLQLSAYQNQASDLGRETIEYIVTSPKNIFISLTVHYFYIVIIYLTFQKCVLISNYYLYW